jgi:hypothetical protein
MEMKCLEKLRHEEIVRKYIRSESKKFPFSDYGSGANLWAKIEDICCANAYVPHSMKELEIMVHGVKAVLINKNNSTVSCCYGTFKDYRLDIILYKNIFRFRTHRGGISRVVTMKVNSDGAKRIGDHESGRKRRQVG